MPDLKTVTGTVVAASHMCNSDRISSNIVHKIRLDTGALLIAKSYTCTTPLFDDEEESTLTKLYNSASGGLGHKLEIELDVSRMPVVSIYGVKDMGPDPAFPKNSLCRDRGFLDSLPIVGRLRGNQLRSPS